MSFNTLSQLQSEYKILLTGTPVQNNLTELWTLLTFLMPGLFEDVRLLSDWFNRPFEVDSRHVASANVNVGDHGYSAGTDAGLLLLLLSLLL